jgi:hypothetical protein
VNSYGSGSGPVAGSYEHGNGIETQRDRSVLFSDSVAEVTKL